MASAASHDGARGLFLRLADELQGAIRPDERFLASFAGEDSDFARLNRGRIRQAGRVTQRSLSVDLVLGHRHAAGEIAIGGDDAADRAALRRLVEELRAQLPLLPEDPHLLYSHDAEGIERVDASALPPAESAVREVLDAADGLDLVGIWASGEIHAGFASSFGQRSWRSSASFNLDWSCYDGERAAKCLYAGSRWDGAAFRAKLARARADLAALARPPKAIAPGRYRAYFAPAAVEDLMGMLGWGGFSEKERRASTSPLLRLTEGSASFHPSVAISEDRAVGFTPLFTGEGFRKAECVTMIEGGRWREGLISPRTAKEFGLAPNSGREHPESLAMAAGELPLAEAAARLGDGLWINNVWYCNYSDRNACRITGMTRFACFWVERGEIVAPLPVMRFDYSMYGLFGDRLLGITRERELMLSSSTYGSRSTASALLPGILVDGLALTL